MEVEILQQAQTVQVQTASSLPTVKVMIGEKKKDADEPSSDLNVMSLPPRGPPKNRSGGSRQNFTQI